MTTQNQLTHSTFVGIVEAIGKIEDGSGNNVFGEVTASPAANTVLDRLKAIETVQKNTRYGRDITLSWIYGVEETAPAAATALVTRAVTAGKKGHVYGFQITTGEGNAFKINWTVGAAAKSMRITFSAIGSIFFTDVQSLFESTGADAATNITITNVSAAGAGIIYQAAILYGEV